MNLNINSGLPAGGGLYREYRFYPSHEVNVEIQCGINRLELPSSMLSSITEDDAEELFVSAFITAYQRSFPLHSSPDPYRCALVWDYVLALPVLVKDLPRDATIVFSIWSEFGELFGTTFTRLFDSKGVLKCGKQKMIFHRAEKGKDKDGNEIIEPLPSDMDLDNNYPENEYDTLYAQFDSSFILEKKIEHYKTSSQANVDRNSSKLEWLDRLTLMRMQESLSTLTARVDNSGGYFKKKRDSSNADEANGGNGSNISTKDIEEAMDQDVLSWSESKEERDLRENLYSLVIEFSQYPYPVLYEEKLYPKVKPHYPPTDQSLIMSACVVGYNGETSQQKPGMNDIIEFSVTGKNFHGDAFRVIADWKDPRNPCEEQYRSLTQEHPSRGSSDPSLNPDLEERKELQRIVSMPAFGEPMRLADKDFLFKFRYYLTENNKALTKYLLAVNWNSREEIAEVPVLLNLWRKKAPIDISDALKLLGRGECFQRKIIRAYAVETLSTASDNDLLEYLLQLVQALRYDQGMEEEEEEGKTIDGVVDHSQSSPASSKEFDDTPNTTGNSLTDGTKKSDDEEVDDGTPPTIISSTTGKPLSLLASFLIHRACKSPTVANFLYWYLKVETEDEISGLMFSDVFDSLLIQVSTFSESGKKVAKRQQALDEYMNCICACQCQATQEKGRKDVKVAKLRELLRDEIKELPGGVSSVPMPLDPSIPVNGIIAEKTIMFSSAIYPAVVTFTVNEKECSSIDKLSINDQGKHIYKLLIKSGDDLRQDQLVMQMMNLMYGILKKYGLDLEVLTYGILATTKNDGIMEFVDPSIPVSAVLAEYKGINNYLRKHNPDESSTATYGVKPKVLERFIKSTAAACVLTYILGIGDRHLDNLMMKPDGHLFHIDFGFIFGRDPKPLPPPFRLIRQFVDAMGGEESEHYARFKSYCFQAYNLLRNSASLILNLLSLMADAGIPDLSIHSNPDIVLAKIEEKFRLDLTDEQAEAHFANLINESVNAIAPRIMEIAHQIAVARR